MRTADGPTPGSQADLEPEADPEQVARTILLRKLTASPRTRGELAEDLRKRGIPADVAERVLDRFVEVGLINDEEFARSWVGSRQRTRSTATPVLRQELRAKGVDDDIIADVLADIDRDAERERGLELVRRKARSMSSVPRETALRRLSGTLVRRGYRQGEAMSIVREVLGESSDEDWLTQ